MESCIHTFGLSDCILPMIGYRLTVATSTSDYARELTPPGRVIDALHCMRLLQITCDAV